MLVAIDNISKIYPKHGTNISGLIREIFLPDSLKKTDVVAISDISLKINDGERVGIIGNNGAGKTTLLQIIAGLVQPTSGTVKIKGHVNCVMTLGIGLREELSGRENIYIDGELNSKLRQETEQIIDDIIEFADIGEFIDRPVRTYSSGMKARLAFSTIIFIEPEILIIDEALSVGDKNFGTKASLKMKEICKKGKILILVSHSMNTIVDMCERCIWLDNGKIIMDGNPKDVTDAFIQSTRLNDEKMLKLAYRNRIQKKQYYPEIEIETVKFINSTGKSQTIFHIDEFFALQCIFKVIKSGCKFDINLTIERSDGIIIINRMASDDISINCYFNRHIATVPICDLRLGKGTYQAYIKIVLQEITGPKIVAICGAVLQIENSNYPHINPVAWWPATWNCL